MTQPFTLVVFGASGGIGRSIVQLALERGDHVRAVYRTAPLMTPSPVYTPILTSSILEAQVIMEAICGADAVVSAVGLRRRHPVNPYSRLTSPPDLTSRFAATLVAVMQQAETPRRVVAISAAGVGDSADRLSPLLKLLFRTSTIGRAYLDLARMEQMYRSSGLQWLCVRPTTLTNRSGNPQPVRVTVDYGMFSRIARVDVANYALDRLHDPSPVDWLDFTPMITGN